MDFSRFKPLILVASLALLVLLHSTEARETAAGPFWCFDSEQDAFVVCPVTEACVNKTYTLFGVEYGPYYSCGGSAECANYTVPMESCGHINVSVEATICCCDTDYCNNPVQAAPTPSTPSTTPSPPLYCYDSGLDREDPTWKLCKQNQVCQNETIFTPDGSSRTYYYCENRNFCLEDTNGTGGCYNNSVFNEMICCCDTDYCNAPGVEEFTPTTTPHSTTPEPTTTSFAPQLFCFSNVRLNSTWAFCPSGEVCTNSTTYDLLNRPTKSTYNCRSRNSCAALGIEMGSCKKDLLSETICCCDQDYCNNPGVEPYTKPVTPIATTPTPVPSFNCYMGNGNYATCPQGTMCANTTYFDTTSVTDVAYSCQSAFQCFLHLVFTNTCNVFHGTFYCCCTGDGCNEGSQSASIASASTTRGSSMSTADSTGSHASTTGKGPATGAANITTAVTQQPTTSRTSTHSLFVSLSVTLMVLLAN